MTIKHETLAGWGNAPQAECDAFRPEKSRELARLIATHQGGLIVRGLGRSYGDAALQPTGVVRMERFDHLLAFHDDSGVMRAQAGMTLSDLMAFATPRSWFPPVLPGTRHVTLGGAFASNVHGKNQWRDGDFAEHVRAIRLRLASGESVECSPSQHADMFWATAGGMGMTGVIEEVELRLRPIESRSLSATSYRVNSIADMVGAFESHRDSADYMVGWIDHMAKGDEIGRGVFEAAQHIGIPQGGTKLDAPIPQARTLNVPFFLPQGILNRYSMALYNKRRFKQHTQGRTQATVDFEGFFHPLDRIGHWNRLYGRQGFFQYQCLIPETPDVAGRLHAFLSALQRQRIFSFLAVIKYHRDGKGMIPFSQRGYSVALDFPNTARVRACLAQVDRWVADNGGRVYLAKDALLTPELFDRMYGQAARDWREAIHDLDPKSRFTSMMSQRLQWKP